MTVKRMDNVGIVVEDIDAAIEFFTELGLQLEGRAPVAGGVAELTGQKTNRSFSCAACVDLLSKAREQPHGAQSSGQASPVPAISCTRAWLN
jgi:catechol 2,3-dioxygenase-like lactoylglutathione lyase family enzyme